MTSLRESFSSPLSFLFLNFFSLKKHKLKSYSKKLLETFQVRFFFNLSFMTNWSNLNAFFKLFYSFLYKQLAFTSKNNLNLFEEFLNFFLIYDKKEKRNICFHLLIFM